jgi:hypothetical protein
MTDTEKKIADIREALEFNGEWWRNVVEGEPICQDEIDEVNDLIEANRFLLSELDRIQQEYAEEHAAHNAHVTELCELEQEQDGVNKLLQERQRLIDGLLTIMNIASEDGVHWKLDRCYTTARDILKEVGVLSR